MSQATRLLALLVALGLAAPATAQQLAQRTWVSGIGDDLNPCSRTAPCKTFAGAISKTTANGEINCLDSAGFGAVTITKSITILCDGVIGGVLAVNSNGITINAADTDKVLLSGLDINGTGTAGIGIRIVRAGSVVIRNSTIYGFATASGRGISAEGTGSVLIDSTTVVHNTIGVFGPARLWNGTLVAANGTNQVEN